ncbi:hypothetical protein GCM10010435_29890 [Winogradskya consettensis]|uniref:Uncharacterized protein n=1 Tax=Winogradskya consettensis TaxID=113560 RepID=A0A919VP17_9ACTN|nr:hypothetical protein Aco04nite_21610 [Actinoplanes consettensis]
MVCNCRRNATLARARVGRQTGNLFGERALRALGRQAHEPSYLEVDRQPAAADREIRHPALVTSMYPL